MLYERKQLKELHYMKHRNDDSGVNYDYEKNIFNKSLSPYIFKSDLMSSFLSKLQPLVSILFDHMNLIKNWKNYNVDKFYYKHRG
jgi:hypothetical protein